MNNKLLYPTRNPYITQHYGNRSRWYRTYHRGTDFRIWNDEKESIFSAQEGKIYHVDDTSPGSWFNSDGSKSQYYGVGSPFGNHVIMEHKLGEDVFYTLYGHLDRVFVKRGVLVVARYELGEGGNTGNSHGAHLHFEARKSAFDTMSSFNPEPLFVTGLTDQASHWAKDAQKFVMETKLPNGNSLSNGTRPQDQITREEAWTMLDRYHQIFNS